MARRSDRSGKTIASDDGDRPVIALKRKRGLIALLRTMKPLHESFPEIDDPAPASGSAEWRARRDSNP
jgi:hypothetical protein